MITITITNDIFRHIWFNKTALNVKFLKTKTFMDTGISLGHATKKKVFLKYNNVVEGTIVRFFATYDEVMG